MVRFRPTKFLIGLVVVAGLAAGFLVGVTVIRPRLMTEYSSGYELLLPNLAAFCCVPAGGIVTFLLFWLFVRPRQS